MKIVGNTVGTTMPRSNLKQDDPKKADYVIGKDEYLDNAVEAALKKAKESGEFDGKDGYTPQKGVDYTDGKDGYTPQKGVDYTDGKDGYTPQKGVDYWTEADKTEIINESVDKLGAINHGNHVPITEAANNARFLRNDNTWQTVTPANIGAVPTSRTVNGKALSDNISLSASDVGARPSSWTPSKSDVGLGNVANERQYSANNPPPYPVTSVNGKTGAVSLSAGDVGARASDWMPTADEVGAAPKNINIVTPDNFSGTDSQKLQAAFDALSSSGGVITINREYVLTENVLISHNSNAHNNLITVKGDGQVPKINFGVYRFESSDPSTHVHGGVIFKDLWLSGESIGFDCSHLIRLTFDNCMIRGFTNFIYSSDYIQSVYFMGCYFRKSSGASVKTIDANDLKIIGCVCEWGKGLIEVSGTDSDMAGCSITDNCIEGYTGIPIILPEKCQGVNISNNYFESNCGENIDARATTKIATISICNNLFTEYSKDADGNGTEDENEGIILLPTTIADGKMIVSGNRCTKNNALLLRVPDGATDLSNLYVFGNNGTTNNTSLVKMLTPKEIADAVAHVINKSNPHSVTVSQIGAAAASHGNHVPTTQTANNATFLRNDNTWQKVTPANIGAAASSHGNHVPTTESANNTRFLRNDNTWQTVTPANIGAVPTSRTVNGKALSGNISLSASDVGARANSWLPSTTDIGAARVDTLTGTSSFEALVGQQYGRAIDQGVHAVITTSSWANGEVKMVGSTAGGPGIGMIAHKVNSSNYSGIAFSYYYQWILLFKYQSGTYTVTRFRP